MTHAPRVVAVLGASGFVGQVVTRTLLASPSSIERVVSVDVRPSILSDQDGRLHHEELDVRSARLGEILAAHAVDTVVHLAAVVTPPPGMSRNEHYAIDVDGTHNVLEACVECGVRQLVVTSSGAAYGFHVDNPSWIDEGCPLRGNEELTYARHKRLVEELLAKYRERHPELLQLVFRPGIILGPAAKNQVTELFQRRLMLKVMNGDSRFVFIWDQDAADCITRGIHERRQGVFNLAGDGAMSAEEIATVTGASLWCVSADTLATLLKVSRFFGFTDHGPEHVPFLRHRPVLSNRALKEVFGFTPTRTSRQAFEEWWRMTTS